MPKPKTLQDALRDLLKSGTSGSQDELCDLLAAQGFDVNQSKISRLLRKLGAVKVKNVENTLVYQLPTEPLPPSATLSLTELILDIVANEHVIVIHTSPGSASLIARMLDHNKVRSDILGTLAGDDTIFIEPKSIKNLQSCMKKVKDLFSM